MEKAMGEWETQRDEVLRAGMNHEHDGRWIGIDREMLRYVNFSRRKAIDTPVECVLMATSMNKIFAQTSFAWLTHTHTHTRVYIIQAKFGCDNDVP